MQSSPFSCEFRMRLYESASLRQETLHPTCVLVHMRIFRPLLCTQNYELHRSYVAPNLQGYGKKDWNEWSSNINIHYNMAEFIWTYRFPYFCCTYLLTYLLTHSLQGAEYYMKSWLTFSLSKKSFLYGTQKFITVFTKVFHRTLSWASWIQFAPSILISLRSSLMLSSHLRLSLPSGLLPSGLPTKTL